MSLLSQDAQERWCFRQTEEKNEKEKAFFFSWIADLKDGLTTFSAFELSLSSGLHNTGKKLFISPSLVMTNIKYSTVHFWNICKMLEL